MNDESNKTAKNKASAPKILVGLVMLGVGVFLLINMTIGIQIAGTTKPLDQFPSVKSKLSSLDALVWKEVTTILSENKALSLGDAFLRMRQTATKPEAQLFATWALGEMGYTPALQQLRSNPGWNSQSREETQRAIGKLEAIVSKSSTSETNMTPANTSREPPAGGDGKPAPQP